MLRLRITLMIMWVLIVATPASAAPPVVEGCEVFPADNPWNTDISGFAVNPDSDRIINAINGFGGDEIHPDFGGGVDDWYGIPWITVPGTQPKVPVSFLWDDESDPGPYPIPPDAPIEGGPGAGGDRHVLVIDRDNCMLYETYASEYVGGAEQAWAADSGAIWDLSSNALRPDGWTSADAAGLPIFPGLARCDEAELGTINHAFRVTFSRTQAAYLYPATHEASDYEPEDYPYYPPMGMRLRLEASFSEVGFEGQALAIVQAMKKYGLIVADNGSNWYFSGEYNPNCWDDDELQALKDIPGTAFEVIGSSVGAAPLINMTVDNSPDLSWSEVDWAVGYTVQVSKSPTFPANATTQTYPLSNVTTFTVPTLSADGTYYWRVCARNVANTCGTWSVVSPFTLNA